MGGNDDLPQTCWVCVFHYGEPGKSPDANRGTVLSCWDSSVGSRVPCTFPLIPSVMGLHVVHYQAWRWSTWGREHPMVLPTAGGQTQIRGSHMPSGSAPFHRAIGVVRGTRRETTLDRPLRTGHSRGRMREERFLLPVSYWWWGLPSCNNS